MNHKFVLKYLLALIIIAIPVNARTQTNKIGIVFNADTTLISEYVGLTIFANKTTSLPLNIDIEELIKQKLKSYLDTKYAAEFIDLPDSLKSLNVGFFDSNIGKKLRKWTKTKQEDYDLIIFVCNQQMSTGGLNLETLITPNTNGIFTKAKNTFLYTTITFYAFRTSNAQQLEYYNLGGKLLYKLKKFKLPKDKKTFDLATLYFLEEEYKDYLDQRIKHFLVKSYLMPDIK